MESMSGDGLEQNQGTRVGKTLENSGPHPFLLLSHRSSSHSSLAYSFVPLVCSPLSLTQQSVSSLFRCDLTSGHLLPLLPVLLLLPLSSSSSSYSSGTTRYGGREEENRTHTHQVEAVTKGTLLHGRKIIPICLSVSYGQMIDNAHSHTSSRRRTTAAASSQRQHRHHRHLHHHRHHLARHHHALPCPAYTRTLAQTDKNKNK